MLRSAILCLYIVYIHTRESASRKKRQISKIVNKKPFFIKVVQYVCVVFHTSLHHPKYNNLHIMLFGVVRLKINSNADYNVRFLCVIPLSLGLWIFVMAPLERIYRFLYQQPFVRVINICLWKFRSLNALVMTMVTRICLFWFRKIYK